MPGHYRKHPAMYRLHYAPDNASLIVRLVLEELGLAYETELVERGATAQKSPAYLRLNPMGLIPALETPDGAIFETAAILLYLTDRHGALAPGPQHKARGLYLSWLFATSNGLHADMRQLFYPHLYGGGDTAGCATQTRARIGTHLDRYQALAGAGHGWFAGAQTSALDLYLAVILRWLALYPRGQAGWFALADWPRLHRLAKMIEARPSMRAAEMAEALGPTPLTAPIHANPSKGSAT